MRNAERYYQALRPKGERAVQSGFRATWSPDGGRIAYTRGNHEPPGLYSDFTVRPEQSFRGLGGIEVKELATRSTRLLTASGKDPAWSRDGRWIAFVREPAINSYEEEEVWLMPAAGGEERRIAKGGFPSWSRDSRLLYFHSRQEAWIYALRIAERDAAPQKLCACPSYYPDISPNGKWVAYGLGAEVVIAEIATGRQARSLTVPAVESPGLLATWVARRPGTRHRGLRWTITGLWIYELESGFGRKVVEGPATLGVWAPDGKRFAYDVRGPFFEVWTADLDPGKSTAESLGYGVEIPGCRPPFRGPRTPRRNASAVRWPCSISRKL